MALLKKPKKTKIKDVIVTKHHVPSGKRKYDVQLYLSERKEIWLNVLKRLWKKHKSIKFDIHLDTELVKHEPETDIYTKPRFRSTALSIFVETELREKLETAIDKVLNSYDVHMREGSGWVLNKVRNSEFNVYRVENRGGGGAVQNLRSKFLPEKLIGKNQSVLVLKPTKDQKCFVHCVLAALYPLPAKDMAKRTRPESYIIHEKELDTTMLSYPVTIDQIPAFESKNDLSINVIDLDENLDRRFLYKSKHITKRLIHLLLYNNHYSLIKSFTSFSKFSNKDKRLPCQKCTRYFLARNNKQSKILCNECGRSPQEWGETLTPNLKFKEKGTKLSFNNYNNVCPHPFVYYCDLETALIPIKQVEESGRTRKKKVHQAVAIGLLRCSTVDKFSHREPIIHTGSDCIEKFFKTMKEEVMYMDNVLNSTNYPIHMNEEQILDFEQSRVCYVCDRALKDKEKLRDHNHLKKKHNYRGVICNACNLNRADTKYSKTPLIFHNGGKFDIHFLIQKLHHLDMSSIQLIGKTAENIMSMNLFGKRLVVVDSINHLSASLASLVEKMVQSKKPLRRTARSLGDDPVGLALMSRKGVFPYDYVKNLEILESTTRLPPQKKFYDSLQEKDISKKEYLHAQNVWEHFDCKNLQEYMTVYLRSDITLLADVFENYRDFFLKEFGLDCAKYLSLPGLSYDCMLRYTKVKLEYVKDLETYQFLRRGTRGGVSMIPHRYAKANNPELNDYDETKECSHLVYLDCNALYSSIMTKKLPFKHLRWVEMTKEEMKEVVMSYSEKDTEGYLVECDLEYPPKIHDLTKDLPLAPEHRIVTQDMMSSYAKKLQEKMNITPDKIPKLLSTQYDKQNYVCHIENLQFYLQKGMVLKKIHKVLKFRQKAFLKPYVELCIKRRNQPGTTEDERSMWKLCCNAIFGKTITNIEKKNAMRLICDGKKLLRAVSSPRFKHADFINAKTVQVSSSKKCYTINTPYYIGVCILDLSKLHLMKLHYEYFLRKYGRFRLQLCMTDTDSLLYHIQTDNLHKDLKETGIVEFSNYPKDHPYYSKKHGGELFYLKDESGGKPIRSFVGLRAKSYSIEYEDEKDNKIVGKGVPRAKLKLMKHEELLEVLKNNTTKNVVSNQLRSYKHEMYSITQEKVALSPLDNKRYMCKDGINTLPHGHNDIVNHQE